MNHAASTPRITDIAQAEFARIDSMWRDAIDGTPTTVVRQLWMEPSCSRSESTVVYIINHLATALSLAVAEGTR